MNGWLSFLGNRLLLALLLVSLVPLALTGIILHRSASRAIEDQVLRQLETVRTITTRSADRYFKSVQEQVHLFAQDRITREALLRLRAGLADLVREGRPTQSDLAGLRRELAGLYVGELATDRGAAAGPSAEAYADALDDAAVRLQELYLRAHDHAAGARAAVDDAGDGSAYSKAHAEYHPMFRGLVQKLGIDDLMLVDAASGTIVYGVQKQPDLGASLRRGPLANTTLAGNFEEAVRVGRRDTVFFSGFERYAPAAAKPTGFVGSPIFDGRDLVGVAVFQIPLSKLQERIGETTGMGQTGEVYAVGPDRLFRTNSRFARDLGVESTILDPAFKVDTRPIRAVLDDGQAGTAATIDYRGTKVLSSWAPLTIRNGDGAVRWAIVAEIDEAEVLEPVDALRRLGQAIFVLTSVGVIGVSTLIARRLTQESRRQAALVGGIVDNTHALASSSEELTSVSQQMSAAAEQTTAQANLVSAAAEQVSGNARTVSGSIDNLVASIHEIARNAQDAASTARRAVDMAGATSSTMAALGRSSTEIGAVVKVITSIAEQTNLLALNATIEAARAGDAGKGFAVVAGEVKELARDTAKATEDIGARIEGMQADTARAVAAIAEIGKIIEQIDSLQTRIAAAVEEQSMTTGEISRNITEATTGSAEIAENIVQVAQAAQSTAEGAANTQVASQELARMAQGLQRLVDDYKRQ